MASVVIDNKLYMSESQAFFSKAQCSQLEPNFQKGNVPKVKPEVRGSYSNAVVTYHIAFQKFCDLMLVALMVCLLKDLAFCELAACISWGCY